MDRRERTARALIQVSRIFLVLGGLLLAVMSLYAPGSRRRRTISADTGGGIFWWTRII